MWGVHQTEKNIKKNKTCCKRSKEHNRVTGSWLHKIAMMWCELVSSSRPLVAWEQVTLPRKKEERRNTEECKNSPLLLRTHWIKADQTLPFKKAPFSVLTISWPTVPITLESEGRIGCVRGSNYHWSYFLTSCSSPGINHLIWSITHWLRFFINTHFKVVVWFETGSYSVA